MKKATKDRNDRKSRGMHDLHLWLENWLMEKVRLKAKDSGRTITSQMHRDLAKLYGED